MEWDLFTSERDTHTESTRIRNNDQTRLKYSQRSKFPRKIFHKTSRRTGSRLKVQFCGRSPGKLCDKLKISSTCAGGICSILITRRSKNGTGKFLRKFSLLTTVFPFAIFRTKVGRNEEKTAVTIVLTLTGSRLTFRFMFCTTFCLRNRLIYIFHFFLALRI